MRIFDALLVPLLIFGPLFIVIGLADASIPLVGQLIGGLGAFMLGLAAARMRAMLANQAKEIAALRTQLRRNSKESGASPLAPRPEDTQ